MPLSEEEMLGRKLEIYETLADYQKEYPCSCLSHGGSMPCNNCTYARSGAVTIKEFNIAMPDEKGFIPNWMKGMI